MKNMSKKQREQRDRGLMILWCLSQRNAAIDAYKKAVRKYCLTCENWNEVCKASAECHRNGVTDEELIEIDLEVQNDITDEDVLKAVYGE